VSYLGLPDRERAWFCIRELAYGPHDLSTPVLPGNLAQELLDNRDELIASYEAKVQDLARETLRASVLQEQRDDLIEQVSYLLEGGHLDETGKKHAAQVIVYYAAIQRGIADPPDDPVMDEERDRIAAGEYGGIGPCGHCLPCINGVPSECENQ